MQTKNRGPLRHQTTTITAGVSPSFALCACLVATFANINCGGSGGGSSATIPTVSQDTTRNAKVFTNGEDLEIAVLPVKIDNKSDYLVQVRGTESEINGLVFPAIAKKNGDTKGYQIMLHGEAFWPIRENLRDANRPTRSATLPEDYRKNYRVYPDDEKAKSLDKDAMVSTFVSQMKDGTLPKVQAWNRAERQTLAETELAKTAEGATEACGQTITSKVDWNSVTDQHMKDLSISAHCEEGVEVFEKLCKRFPDMNTRLGGPQTVTCSFAEADKDKGLSGSGGKYTWGMVESNASQKAWATGMTTFNYDKLVAEGPKGLMLYVDRSGKHDQLYAGKKGKLALQRMDHNGYVFGGSRNGRLQYDSAEWELKCGKKQVKLSELSTEKKTAFLEKADVGGLGFDREPMYLARDSAGTYYYVDRLVKQKGGKDYKVYMGRKGAAKPTALKDIVDDSRGLIFETKKGDLRLVVTDYGNGDYSNAQGASWERGGKGKPKPLTVLPVIDNLKLIFEELGAYDGRNWSTVCDQI